MRMLTLTSTTKHANKAKVPHVLDESSSVWIQGSTATMLTE
jgi:hypothetical protein